MSAANFEFRPGPTALLISFPHSGLAIPDAIRARLTPAALAVPDTDWHVPSLYDFYAELGASAIIAGNSRYVVDLNRPPDGALLYPGKTETGICPLRSFADEALYLPGQEPGADEIAERIAMYWQPYHRRLSEAIDAIRNRHGHCVLWDAHSIKSEVPVLFDGRLPDLNVGTADNRSCSRVRSERVLRQLQSQSTFSSVLNGRFKGGYITRHYGDPARGVDAVQLEIAQSAYLSEARPQHYDPTRAAGLKTVLKSVLKSALDA
jgi:N-formylglutamate deformylase